MSLAVIVAALEQFGTLAPSELRSRPGPRGEPFLLPPAQGDELRRATDGVETT